MLERYCPAAHRVQADLPLLRDSHNASWIALSTGTSDISSDSLDMIFTQLVSVTGAIMEKEENDYCKSATEHIESFSNEIYLGKTPVLALVSNSANALQLLQLTKPNRHTTPPPL